MNGIRFVVDEDETGEKTAVLIALIIWIMDMGVRSVVNAILNIFA
jgi:hypothetical protein